MNSVIGKGVRNAAALVVLSARGGTAGAASRCNYDVLLQTRTQTASFKNSVVFPGGVCESADASSDWLRLFHSFGFTEADFAALHRSGSAVPLIFGDNPVLRHISLRITAIRETFEELGLLVCSRSHKGDRSGVWASAIEDFDVQRWQSKVAENPSELLSLCEELKCYPDIWSLHYWSNWLTPAFVKKRFNTAFFLAALKGRPAVRPNEEVVKVEWQAPSEVLARSPSLVLYPPQGVELARLRGWAHAGQLAAAARGAGPEPVYYHATVRAADGKIAVYSGDDLYPSSIDFNTHTIIDSDKSVEELRETSHTAHRIEFTSAKLQNLVLKNFAIKNKDMGNQIVPINITLS